jgi:xanthosine utilization system XapX-like protein
MVQQAPMIAQLITQLGLPIANVIRPERALLLDREQTAHNVFYVTRADGSPYIVEQEAFVARYGIQSVLGFGGLLATGDLFAVIMFSRVAIPPDVADQFGVVGLNLKLAILPFVRKPMFR